MITELYENDFYAWTIKNAELLRQGRIDEIDADHIAEELEGMGKSEKRELISRLEILLLHLLKWKFQENMRSRSWQLSIEEQRIRIQEHILENSSLKAIFAQLLAKAYRYARIRASRETGLPLNQFPEISPFDEHEIMNHEFLP